MFEQFFSMMGKQKGSLNFSNPEIDIRYLFMSQYKLLGHYSQIHHRKMNGLYIIVNSLFNFFIFQQILGISDHFWKIIILYPCVLYYWHHITDVLWFEKLTLFFEILGAFNHYP